MLDKKMEINKVVKKFSSKSKSKTPRRLPKVYQEQADKREKERIQLKKERESKPPEKEKVIVQEEEVAKFLFLTQVDGIHNYTGPSGINYISYIGQPFEVRNKPDIQFFNNQPKRFQKVGLTTKLPEPPKDIEELLEDYLKGIKGLTKKTTKRIVELYTSKENLISEIEQKYKMDPSLSKNQQDKIKKHILGDI